MSIERKTILFIDNSNIFKSQFSFNKIQEAKGKPRYRIEWEKVLEYFIKQGTPIFDTHFFGSHPNPPSALQDEFYRRLANKLKFQLHLRELLKRTLKCGKCGKAITTCPHCGNTLPDFKEKGVDVDIAVSLITQADNFDTAVLYSGDRDLIGPVEYLRQRGKRVDVYAFSHSITDEYARRYISVTIIDDIIDKIARVQKSREPDTPPVGVVIPEEN